MSKKSKKNTDDFHFAIANSNSELRYTLIATTFTLLLVLIIYFLIPKDIINLTDDKGQNSKHQKIYSYHNWGAQLEYKNTVISSNKENTRLKKDLDILQRRFARGNFNILKLPGMQSSSVYKEILPHHNLYKYEVFSKQKGALLEVRVTPSKKRAVKALHNYLVYLEKNWH